MTMTDDEVAWMKAIAKRVKIARVQYDLSQADLAEQASLTRNKISSIERSAELLKLYELNRIGRAADIELADLVHGAPSVSQTNWRLPTSRLAAFGFTLLPIGACLESWPSSSNGSPHIGADSIDVREQFSTGSWATSTSCSPSRHMLPLGRIRRLQTHGTRSDPGLIESY